MLPVVETVFKSIVHIWIIRKQLATALLPLLCVLLLLGGLSMYAQAKEQWALSTLFNLTGWVIGVMYAITVHRIVLMGPDAIGWFGRLGWGRREWAFLLTAIGLALMLGAIALAVILPLSALGIDGAGSPSGYVFLLAVGLPLAIAFARLSLKFPSIAVDSEITFHHSWAMSRGNSVRLSVVVYFIPVIGAVLSWGFYVLLPGWVVEHFGVYLAFAHMALGYILWVVEVACLSFAYKYLSAYSIQV